MFHARRYTRFGEETTALLRDVSSDKKRGEMAVFACYSQDHILRGISNSKTLKNIYSTLAKYY